MSFTLTKSQKSASELAELIRRSVAKKDLRVAVFATRTGWRAKVYPESSENVGKLQARVDAKAALLSEQYELIP
jgi:hypothetical protein